MNWPRDPERDWLPPVDLSVEEAFRAIDSHYRWYRRLWRTLTGPRKKKEESQ